MQKKLINSQETILNKNLIIGTLKRDFKRITQKNEDLTLENTKQKWVANF